MRNDYDANSIPNCFFTISIFVNKGNEFLKALPFIENIQPLKKERYTLEKISTSKNFVNGMETIIPLKNDSPYKKIFVVADIHGCFDKLMSLWKKLEVTDNNLVIFLGDYIDRGAQVAETIKWILEQSKKENFIFLRGNHEQMMLDTFQRRMDKLTWLFNGGQATASPAVSN